MLNAASIFGFFIGALWIVSFALYITGLTQSWGGLLSIIAGIYSIYFCGKLVGGYGFKLPHLSLRHAFLTSLIVYHLSALLMAFAQYIYFRFIDQGTIVAVYSEMMNRPEMIEVMQQMLAGNDVKETIKMNLELMQSLTPIQWTVEFLYINIALSWVIALPTSLIAKWEVKKLNSKRNK